MPQFAMQKLQRAAARFYGTEAAEVCEKDVPSAPMDRRALEADFRALLADELDSQAGAAADPSAPSGGRNGTRPGGRAGRIVSAPAGETRAPGPDQPARDVVRAR